MSWEEGGLDCLSRGIYDAHPHRRKAFVSAEMQEMVSYVLITMLVGSGLSVRIDTTSETLDIEGGCPLLPQF